MLYTYYITVTPVYYMVHWNAFRFQKRFPCRIKIVVVSGSGTEIGKLS